MVADKPVGEVVQVDAVLDGLSSPTSSDVYEALGPYSNDATIAAAARRALEGGGASSLPTGWTADDPGSGDLDSNGGTLNLLTLLFGTGARIETTQADPSSGGGNAKPVGSLLLRNSFGGEGSAWIKTGAGNTAWTQIGGVPAGSFRLVRVPIAFDTTDLVLTGIEVYTPAAGDVVLWSQSFLSVSTAWNGTTPQINFTFSNLAGAFNYASLESTDATGSDGHTLQPPFLGLSSDDIAIFPDSDPLIAIVDDTAAGNPGSSQGEGEIVLLVAS